MTEPIEDRTSTTQPQPVLSDSAPPRRRLRATASARVGRTPAPGAAYRDQRCARRADRERRRRDGADHPFSAGHAPRPAQVQRPVTSQADHRQYRRVGQLPVAWRTVDARSGHRMIRH